MLVSPQRSKRPWQGHTERIAQAALPTYDPTCYLCPGNSRAGGHQNPDYESTFVFDNDFPALVPDTISAHQETSVLFRAEAERGICRVICFSPRHDLTLAQLKQQEIAQLIHTWIDETTALAKNYEWLRYIQIFENKGAMMGCSNPHPHGQIWATEHLPQQIIQEDNRQKQHLETHTRTMLQDIMQHEQDAQQRIVFENVHWLIWVPFWAVWPFEVLLAPTRPVQRLAALTHVEQQSLAEALSVITVKYDNLFRTAFPYSMGFHQAPVNAGEQAHWHLHAHFYPPLLRSAAIKKFMVGYELLGTPQRDITPEQAAERLRELSIYHYLLDE